MKLPIKKEYFDAIKSGEKKMEFRDAHLTFVCEETGEMLIKEIKGVELASINVLPEHLRKSGMFDDDKIIVFDLYSNL